MFEFIRPAIDSRPVIRFAGREAGAGNWEVTLMCVWDGPRETFVRKVEVHLGGTSPHSDADPVTPEFAFAAPGSLIVV